MPTFLEISPAVAARVEGCPNALIVEALRDAAIEFCVQTHFYTVGHTVTLNGTETPYVGLDYQVLDIVDANVDDEPVLITYLNDPAAAEAGPRDYVLRFVDPNNFEFLPVPTLSAPVTVDLLLAVAPGPNANEIGLELWRRHHEALRHGALARLMAEPKKLWSDPQLAAYHRGLFENAMTQAAAEAGRNRVQRGRRLRVHPV